MEELLWLPPSAEQRQRDDRDWRNRMLLEMAEEGLFKRTWDRDLQQIDPRLELLRARESADLPELTPGYWHVVRRNPNGAITVVHTVTGPAGQFKHPDSSLFEELRKNDMWQDRTHKERRDRRRQFEQAKERREQREHEERVEEMTLHLKSIESPGVHFGGKGWTASKKGRGGRPAK
jgi:hypothetical protein